MEGKGHKGNAHPDAHAEVHDPAVEEEALGSSVHEVEEPLLGGVGSVMPNVPSRITRLLVEILLSVPGSPLLLGHAQAFSIRQAHVFCVAVLVVRQAASYTPIERYTRGTVNVEAYL